MERYKCHTCKLVLDETDLVNEKCPICKDIRSNLQKMCELDHCDCSHDKVESVAFCPRCGVPVCPICCSHDVVAITRVTGYLQELGGFNAGKQQEVRDRHRYTI